MRAAKKECVAVVKTGGDKALDKDRSGWGDIGGGVTGGSKLAGLG